MGSTRAAEPGRSLAMAAEPVAVPSGEARSFDFGVVLRILVALVWILWGLKLYQPTFTVSGAPESGFVYTVGGVVALAVACARPTGKWASRLDLILLFGTVVAIGLWTRAAVFGSPAYGTDEVAFDQGAAELLLRGVNPYGADLSWTFDAFRVLPSGTTNTLSGDFVHTLSYPAGAFLVYVPLLAAGVQAQAAIYMDALFWIIGLCTLWWALPSRYRPIVPIFGSLGIYVDYATGGVTDPLMMPFLVIALWRWDRFGDPAETSSARWIGPIALGLACTFKQSAWFIVPMLVTAISIETLSADRGLRPIARYVGLAVIAFLIPNLPFIVLDPRAWVGGVFLPFLEPLVPFGQGFIAISTTFFQGGGALPAYTAAGAAVMAAMILAFVGWYARFEAVAPGPAAARPAAADAVAEQLLRVRDPRPPRGHHHDPTGTGPSVASRRHRAPRGQGRCRPLRESLGCWRSRWPS